MGIFADECEIQALALAEVVNVWELAKSSTCYFFTVGNADWKETFDPPHRLMRLIANLPLKLIPMSHSDPAEPEKRPKSSVLKDKQAGELGYRIVVKIQRWYSGGRALVMANVVFGGLACRGISAEAVREDGRWTLEAVSRSLS